MRTTTSTSAPTVYRLTPTETVTVRERTPEALVVDARYAPGGAPPPSHLHPHQDERFLVTAGRLTVRIGGEERVIGPGEALEVPRGTAHAMWNAGTSPADVRWETRPAGRTEAWWAALQDAGRDGEMPGLLALARPLRDHGDVFVLAVAPRWVLGRALALAAAVARITGR
jgi:quercetin dioxygenase-like cupin family protein